MKLAKLPDSSPGSLASLSTDELKSSLASGLKDTADSLLRLASLWAELERRGVDLSDLRRGIVRYLSAIAAGTLAAEAVLEFQGRPGVLAMLEGLSLDRQRSLAAGSPVAVASGDTVQLVPLTRMPHAAAAKVFAGGVERTPDEQRLGAKPKIRKAKARKYRVSVDRDRGLLRIGKADVSIAEVVAAMSAEAGHEGDIDEDLHAREQGPTATAKLTATEMERLKAAAKAHGLPVGELTRRAVIAMWML
jgi:hypothetical protein